MSVWSPADPFFNEHSRWDWPNAGSIDGRHEDYDAGERIAYHLKQITAITAASSSGQPLPAPAKPAASTAELWSGLVEYGVSSADIAPNIVLGASEEEVHNGIFLTIAAWIESGGDPDTSSEWLGTHPLSSVNTAEPGSAAEWLEEFSANTIYPQWTILGQGHVLDMTSPTTSRHHSHPSTPATD